mgnify:CR=1 FL=1
MKRGLLIAVAAVVMMAFGCAPGNVRWQAPENPAGFWVGIWHGFIIVVTFVVSLFNHSVGVYESNNAGWSYNLGFLLGCTASLGGGFRAGTRSRRRRLRTDGEKLSRHAADGVRDEVRAWLRELADRQEEPDWDGLGRRIEERLREFRRWEQGSCD